MIEKDKYIEEFDEIEEEDTGNSSSDEDIDSPFDPKQIKITNEPNTVFGLVQRMKYDNIDLNTEFQRKGNLWSAPVQSRLIESLLLRFPLPAFYFDATDDDKWLIVDGLQRLWSLKNFIIDEEYPLQLQELEILKSDDFVGKTYKGLNQNFKRRILETPVTTYLIQPGTPKEVKYNVFRRINTSGLTLNPQEIRHALNQGQATDYLRDITENREFKKYLRVRDKRMQDRELVLRHLAYILKSYNDYEKPMATFLDKRMEELNKLTKSKLNDLEESLLKSLEISKKIFGKDIFSRSIVEEKRKMLNIALFEVWSSLIAKLNDRQQEKLLRNKNMLVAGFKKTLNKDIDFVKSISSATSGKAAVRKRFKTIEELINKFIS
jgi:hypothetical protein